MTLADSMTWGRTNRGNSWLPTKPAPMTEVSITREMLRVYRSYQEIGRFETLQRYGAAQARALGVATEQDVARLIDQTRQE